MTYGERLRSLRAAWQLLADDGILCIICRTRSPWNA
jgi:hypothetical protein